MKRRYAGRYIVFVHGKTTLDDHEHGHVITLSRCLHANSEHAHTSSVLPLDVTLVLPRYEYSHKRLLLVDFEGTLW